MNYNRATAAVLAVSLVGVAPAVGAESLADAIALTYNNNPALRSERSQLRAIDEDVVAAKSLLRPQISLQASGSYSKIWSPAVPMYSIAQSVSESNSGTGSLVITQPLYTGGRAPAQIHAAEAEVLSGRNQVRAEEASVLLQAITAYADVLRDRELFKIRGAFLEVISSELDETRARLTAGDATKTDLAQAETQFQSARASLAAARGQVEVSRTNYAAVVGQNPGELDPVSTLPGLPVDLDKAFARGEDNNPTLQAAQASELQSRWKIAEARSEKRPTISAQATYGASGVLEPFYTQNAWKRALTATVQLNQPLFTGGQVSSDIRRALETNNSDREQIELRRRQVDQAVAQAWNAILTARIVVTDSEAQVAAARTAAVGAREEYRAALRSTLDVLYQAQNLRDAEIQLSSARHDAFIAEANLLSALGDLEGEKLIEGLNTYKPEDNYHRTLKVGAVPLLDPLMLLVDSIAEPSTKPLKPRPLAPMLQPPVQRAANPPVSMDAPLATALTKMPPAVHYTEAQPPMRIGKKGVAAKLDPKRAHKGWGPHVHGHGLPHIVMPWNDGPASSR